VYIYVYIYKGEHHICGVYKIAKYAQLQGMCVHAFTFEYVPQ